MLRLIPFRSRDRRRRWTLALAYAALVASCESPFAPEVVEVVRLEVSPAVLQLVVGGNATLTARVYGAGDAQILGTRVFWSSQDPSVVTVNQEGVATAVGPGTAQIAASAGGQSRTIAVTVSQPPIALVRITPPAGTVTVAGTITLTGEALDGTGALLPNRLLEWASSTPAVATVNNDGVVTGVAVGQATISATGEGKTGTALVTVRPAPVASVTIQPDGGTLAAGSTLMLTATPRDASGQALTGRRLEWRSSNDAVATISSSGLLTAISPGVVTITVTAPGEGLNGTSPSASVSVTVLIIPVATAVIVPGTSSVQIGATVALTLNLSGADGAPLSAAGRTIVWSSANPSVATVNSSGVVTGVAIGTASIEAAITTPGQPGSVRATAQVTVSSVPVASIVVSPNPAVVYVGYGRQFSAVARDAQGNILQGRSIIWTSAGQGIAVVDAVSGVVGGVSQGTVEIRATSEGVQGSATVTVGLVPVSSVAVTPVSPVVMPGQTVQLNAAPRDSAGTVIQGSALGNRPTTWTTSNASVATVNTSGLVTGVAVGNANISAAIGGTAGSSAVTVNPLPSASQLAVTTQPSATVQNDVVFPVQPVVQLRDANGNNVSTAGVSIQAAITAPGTGTLGGTATAVTNASGAATFTGLRITGTTGPRTLSFTSGSLTAATSSSINVQAGVPTQLVITAQPPATANSGQVFSTPAVVRLQDVSGNNVPQLGVTVTAAVTPSAGVTLGGGSATTDASGVATFGALSLTGAAGNYTLTFGSGSLTPATSASIALGAGSGSRVSVTVQPSATVQNGVPFPQQPVVQLVDASGNPVAQAGVTVVASIETGLPSLGGTQSAVTNSSGSAAFANLVITGQAGTRTLLFGASGFTAVASSPINVIAGAETALSIVTQPPPTAQSGAAFGSAPSVRLLDQSGNPVSRSGVPVSVSVNGAGASLIGTTTRPTNGSGVATFTGLGLSGTAGAYSLTFSSGALASATSSSVNLTAGAAAQLTITTQPAGATSGSAFTTQPAVQVRDAQGNPVSQAGISITPAIASGGPATLLGGAATTNGAGLAQFAGLGLSGPAGNYTIGFSSGSLAGATSGTIALGPGAAAQLTITTQPAGATSGSAFATQPAIQVRDAQSNPVTTAGIVVSASVNGAGATTIGSASAVTNASGLATFSSLGLSGTAGNYTLDFSSSGLPNVTSGTIALAAGAAARLTISTQPSPAVASGSALAQQPVIQLRDGAGNPVSTSGVVVSAAISPGGATLTGTTTASSANGVATFTNLGIAGTTGNYTISFSASGLTGVTSGTISVTAGSPSQITISTQPAGASSGAAFTTQPAVQLRDASGNAVSQSGVSVTAAIASGPGGGTLVGSGSATTNGSGLATFAGLGLSGTVGNYTLSFTAGAFPPVTSAAITLGPGAPAQMTIQTQPGGATSGAALATQPVIQVRDAQTNLVSQAVTVTASLNGAGATLIGPATAQTSGGVATFSGLGLSGQAGNYTLDFSTPGAPNVTSASFALTAGAATQLTMAVQPSPTVASGSTLATQPAVQLRDGASNPVSQAGVQVTAAIGSGASLIGPVTATTDGTGLATFAGLGVSGTVGTYQLSFTASGLTGTQSANVAVTPGPASQLSITTQPSSPIISGTAFATQPVIQLRDAAGNAVSQSGVGVSAAVTGGGATTVGTATATTNSSGIAAFAGLGISGAGTWTLTFSATGLTSVTSSAVVVTEPASQVSMVTQPSANAQNGVAFAAQPSVRLRDTGGAPVNQAGVSVTASVNGTGATLFGTTTVTTDGTGTATFAGLGLNGTVGQYTLTFSSGSLTSATSNPITLAAGAATKLVVSSQPPAAVASGATFSAAVQLLDANDNVVTTSGVSVSAALNGAGGTLTGGPATTDNAGIAAFSNLSITGTGSFTITFSSTGLTGATSNTIAVAFFDDGTAGHDEGTHTTLGDAASGIWNGGEPVAGRVLGTEPVVAHTPTQATFDGARGRVTDEIPFRRP